MADDFAVPVNGTLIPADAEAPPVQVLEGDTLRVDGHDVEVWRDGEQVTNEGE